MVNERKFDGRSLFSCTTLLLCRLVHLSYLSSNLRGHVSYGLWLMAWLGDYQLYMPSDSIMEYLWQLHMLGGHRRYSQIAQLGNFRIRNPSMAFLTPTAFLSFLHSVGIFFSYAEGRRMGTSTSTLSGCWIAQLNAAAAPIETPAAMNLSIPCEWAIRVMSEPIGLQCRLIRGDKLQ
jgi:hypothetical protein